MSDTDKAILESWSNVGSPGPNSVLPFMPTNEQKQKFKPISIVRIIAVTWKFDHAAYRRLRLGHVAHEMEDKWNIYMADKVVHFHRSWTGVELFRFTVQANEDEQYLVSQFEVEQDPEHYRETNEPAIRETLLEVLQAVLGVSPV